MNAFEKSTLIRIIFLYLTRMLGAFMVLPVFRTYGLQVPESTHANLGYMFAAYGIMQATMQIPLGILADKFNYKKVLYIALSVFFIGSVLGYIASNIYMLIIARAMQGSAAISGVLMAILGVNITEKNKTTSMAILGVCIGMSFILAIFLGVFLSVKFSFVSIFLISSVLSLCGFWAVTSLNTEKIQINIDSNIMQILMQSFRIGWFYHINIFLLHVILVVFFSRVSLFVFNSIHIHTSTQILIYTLTLFVGFMIMAPQLRIMQVKPCISLYILLINALLALSAFVILNYSLSSEVNNDIAVICISMILFFIAFNVFEAYLPASLSQQKSDFKASLMSVFATSQFLGGAVGGILSGFFSKPEHLLSIMYLLFILWILVIAIRIHRRQNVIENL